MIKLAAADMDGTLLDSSHNIPAETAETVLALEKKGIKFAAASGRQYYSLKNLFDSIGISGHMIFMAENGGIIYENDKVLHMDPLPVEMVKEFIGVLSDMPDVRILLSGARSAYIKKGSIDRGFGFNADLYCGRLEQVDDLYAAAESDDIIKIAVYDRDAEHSCYPALKKYNDRCNVVLSNVQWVDIVAKTVSKGNGLRHIAEHMGIGSEEVMAFGDYMNDYDMIKYAGESYAMANGHPDLIAAAKHTAPSNDEHGVIRVLEQLLSE